MPGAGEPSTRLQDGRAVSRRVPSSTLRDEHLALLLLVSCALLGLAILSSAPPDRPSELVPTSLEAAGPDPRPELGDWPFTLRRAVRAIEPLAAVAD